MSKDKTLVDLFLKTNKIIETCNIRITDLDETEKCCDEFLMSIAGAVDDTGRTQYTEVTVNHIIGLLGSTLGSHPKDLSAMRATHGLTMVISTFDKLINCRPYCQPKQILACRVEANTISSEYRLSIYVKGGGSRTVIGDQCKEQVFVPDDIVDNEFSEFVPTIHRAAKNYDWDTVFSLEFLSENVAMIILDDLIIKVTGSRFEALDSIQRPPF